MAALCAFRSRARCAKLFTGLLAASSAGLALCAASPALAQSTAIVASTGQGAPDGVGLFSFFDSPPALNNTGQAAFQAFLDGPGVTPANGAGIFRGDGAAALTQVVRGGQPGPGGTTTYLQFFSTSLNDAGQVAISGVLTGAGVTSVNDGGIFRGDGLAAPAQIVREGQAAPGGVGTFLNAFSSSLNNAGQVAFLSGISLSGGASTSYRGIFRGNGSLPPIMIARSGEVAPGGGTFVGFAIPRLNNAGQAVFLGGISNSGGVATDEFGLFRGDGITALAAIARVGQPAPGGVGVFIDFIGPIPNEVDQTAFLAILGGAGVTGDNAVGIYRRDGGASPVQIVRTGQTAPDGIAAYSTLSPPTFNDAGQVAFLSILTGPGITPENERGLFRGNGVGDDVQIARGGQAVPDGSADFLDFELPALNQAGQVAFIAYLTGPGVTETNDLGLYFYDDALGLLSVARKGDALLGSTITSLTFNADPSDERSGLNNLSQVAYQFSLANGNSGIAIVTIPEPASLSVLAVAGFALLRRRAKPRQTYTDAGGLKSKAAESLHP